MNVKEIIDIIAGFNLEDDFDKADRVKVLDSLHKLSKDTCPDCGGSGKDIRKCQTCGRIGCVYRGKGEGLAFEIGCEETCRTCKGKELSKKKNKP